MSSISDTSCNHVVLLWFHDGITEKDIEEIANDMQELMDIDAVISVETGRPVASERDVVDGSFHLGSRILLNDGARMNEYLMDSIHVDVGLRHKHKISKQLVYDF